MIKITNAVKIYGKNKALSGVNLQISPGSIHGVLGPNGAGKTTLIKILSGLIDADTGEITHNGEVVDPAGKSYRRVIGLIPQEIALYGELSAYRNLVFWGGLHGISRKDLSRKADEVLKRIGLYERRDDAISTYSGGMKRRINIGAALMHEPDILFMDEPTVGIDPHSRNLIYDLIKDLNAEGMTILYTSHYLPEVEMLCDKITIVDEGRVVGEGTLEELRAGYRNLEAVRIGLKSPLNEQMLADVVAIVAPFSVEAAERGFLIRGEGVTRRLADLISRLNVLDLNLRDIDTQPVTLETVFLELTGRQLRD
ncbi:MAG: ABC-2 type transport system ATP-binding protein [Neolewinella sp.]|jgi:ABC-2 type transport system ATP-binding protein